MLPPLPPVAQRLARLLRLPQGSSSSSPAGRNPQASLDPLQQAGRLLRQARDDQGISLRQLAQETRISTAVLEALERGWRDRLPEPTYLRTMVPILERHLSLPQGTLNAALPVRGAGGVAGTTRDKKAPRFTPGSIDVFTTWQGTLLYGLMTLALVHLLNLQQFRIASQGLFSSRPLPPLREAPTNAMSADAALLAAFPDLRPMSQAAAGQGLQQWRKESKQPGPDLSLGVLSLTTGSPSRVTIESERGGNTALRGVEGELSLPLLPPFQLEISPEPLEGAVRWRGRPLSAQTDRPGRFVVPTAKQPSTSAQGNKDGAPRRNGGEASEDQALPRP